MGYMGENTNKATKHIVTTRLRSIAIVAVIFIAGILSVALPARPAAAAINEQMNYQGRLLDSTGAIVPDGTYNMEFKIYQDGTGCVSSGTSPCGGTLKWTETRTTTNRVTLRNGYFSVQLGEVTPFASLVDWNQSTLWLSVNVGGTATSPTWDGEMLPFRRLAASPYALNAAKVGGLDISKLVQLGPSAVQVDSTTLSSININKTGASGNILQLQRGGADTLVVSNTGAVTSQNTTDSTTAFRILQSTGNGGNPVFVVDTSGNKVLIGNPTGDTTGTLLVLDTKTDAGDPTGQNGGMYYNSNTNKFRCYQNGAWTDCIGAGSAGINNSTSQQTANYNIISAASGSTAAQIQGAANGTVPVLIVKGSSTPGVNASIMELQDSSAVVQVKVDSTGKTTFSKDVLVNNPTSTSAFVVQGGSNAFVTVNTSASKFYIGNPTDCGGRFCVTNTVTGSAGSTYTNSLNNTIASVSGASTFIGQEIVVDDDSSSVANTIRALRIDTSGSTNTSATINSIQVKLASGASGTAIQIQNGSTDVLNVNNNGITAIKTTTDSTTAFTVQGTTGVNILTADTFNNTVRLRTSQSDNQATYNAIWLQSAKNTVTAMIGDNDSTAAYTANDFSGNLRWNGSNVGWGDIGFYPQGGGTGSNGHFRFSTTGSAVNTTPNAKVGMGDLYVANNAGIGTNNPSYKLHVTGKTGIVQNTSSSTDSSLLVEQTGTGDSVLEIKNPTKNFYLGIDTSDGGTFKLSSATAAASGSTTTVGYSQGATDDSGNSAQIIANRVQTGGTGGSVSTISFYVGALSGSNKQAQVAIYADNGSGTKPSTLIASAGTQTLTADSWNEFSISATVAASTYYWLAFQVNDNGTHTPYAGTGITGTAQYFTQASFGTWTSNLTSVTPTTTQQLGYSMRMSVTATGTYDNLNVGLLRISDTGSTTFQNSTDSTTAFRVSKSNGTNVLAVDTTNSSVSVGLLKLSNQSADPTGSTGAMYYNTTTSKFRCYEGAAWANCVSSGGSPGGSTTQIQFNDGGAFGGDADLVWDKTNNAMTLAGTDTGIVMTGATNEPGTPSAGTLRIYSKSIAGRVVPKWKGPSGLDNPVQAALYGPAIAMLLPNSSNTVTTWGMPNAVTGTISTPTIASTTLKTSMRRIQVAGTAATFSAANLRAGQNMVWRGGATGQGGFFLNTRFSTNTTISTQTMFVGLAATSSALSGATLPSANVNIIGAGWDDTDGNLVIMSNDGSGTATKVNLGASYAKNNTSAVYDLTLFSQPNGTNVGYRIARLDTGVETSGTISTDLPSTTTFLTHHEHMSSGNTASAVQLEVMRVYLESDN